MWGTKYYRRKMGIPKEKATTIFYKCKGRIE
jgi:hypothetical protein